MSSVNSPGKGFVKETKGGRTRWVKPSTGAHTAWVSSSNSGSSSSSSRHVSSRSSSSSSRKLTSEEQKLVSQGFTPEYSDGKVRYVKGGAHTAWRSSSEWSKAASEAKQTKPKPTTQEPKSKVTQTTDYIAKGYEAKTGKQVQPSWVNRTIVTQPSKKEYVPPSPEMELLFPSAAKAMKYEHIITEGIKSYKEPRPTEEATWNIEKSRDKFLTSESKKAKAIRAARAVSGAAASLFWETVPVTGPALNPEYQYIKGVGERGIIKEGEKQIQKETEQKKLLKAKAEKEIKEREAIVLSRLNQRKEEYQKIINSQVQDYANTKAQEIYSKKGKITEKDVKKIKDLAQTKSKKLIEEYNKKLQKEAKINYQIEVDPLVKKYNKELGKSKATERLNKVLKRYNLATQFVETPIKVTETMLIPGVAGTAVGGLYAAQIGTHPIETARSMKEHPGLAAVTIGSALIGAKLAKPIKAEYYGMRMRSDLAKGSKYSSQTLKISTKKAGKLEVGEYRAKVSEGILGKKYSWKVESVGKGVRAGKGSKGVLKGHQGYVAKLTKKTLTGKEKKLYVEVGEPIRSTKPSRISLSKGGIEKGVIRLKTTKIIPSRGRIFGRKPKIKFEFDVKPYVSKSKPSNFFKSELYGKKPTKITYETVIGGKKPIKASGELHLAKYMETAKTKIIPEQKLMVSKPFKTTTGEPFVVSKILTKKPRRITGGVSYEVWGGKVPFKEAIKPTTTKKISLGIVKSSEFKPKFKPKTFGKSTKAIQIPKTKTPLKVKPSISALKDITKQFGKTKSLAELGKSRIKLAITKASEGLVKPTGLRTIGSLGRTKLPEVEYKFKGKGAGSLRVETKPTVKGGSKQFGIEISKLNINQELFQPTKIKTGIKTPEVTGIKTKLGSLTIEELKMKEFIISPPAPTTPPSPTIRTPPNIVPFLTPPTGLLFGARGFGKGSKKMKTVYTANLAGIFSEKYLKATPKKKTYTGLELRYPVLPKGTWKI